jgi:NADPH:quinone reductase-like Zn-dependent oxidoreductase
MKAAVITAHGGLDVLDVREMPRPRPGRGEALVEVRAAALNHLDIWVRRGGRSALTFPHIIGSDGAGVVVELGPDVDGPPAGTEVVLSPALVCRRCPACRRGEQSMCEDFGILGMSSPGTFAQYVAVPADNLWPKPPHLNWHEAAGLVLAYGTAWRMLFTRGRLAGGQMVLIHGIGGGVAVAALQLARLAGARVIATSSSPQKLAAARELGAAETIDYRTTDVADAALAFAGPAGVDLIIDSVGAATMAANLRALRKGGRVVLCGVTGGDSAQVDLRAVYWRQLEIVGSTSSSDDDLRQMLAAVAANRLRPVVDKVFALEQVRQATQRMEQAGQFGKIVLAVS